MNLLDWDHSFAAAWPKWIEFILGHMRELMVIGIIVFWSQPGSRWMNGYWLWVALSSSLCSGRWWNRCRCLCSLPCICLGNKSPYFSQAMYPQADLQFIISIYCCCLLPANPIFSPSPDCQMLVYSRVYSLSETCKRLWQTITVICRL